MVEPMEALQSEIAALLGAGAGAVGPHLPEPLERDFTTEWEGERVALQEIYGPDFRPFQHRDHMFSVQLVRGEPDPHRQLWLCFVIPAGYPLRPCIVEVEPNRRLSRKQTDIFYGVLAGETANCVGIPMVFNLCSTAVTLLECLEAGDNEGFLRLINDRGEGTFCNTFVDVDIWEIDAPSGPKARKGPNPCLAGSSQMVFTPTTFTGPIAEILARLPPTCEVLHVESVLRRDLALRFDHQQHAFFTKYVSDKRGSRMDARANALSNVTVAFHGTQAHKVYDIVREGLVVPGEETGVAIASGSRYGQGVYLSPDPDFSLHYCRGQGRLLVCAVLLGRPWVVHTDVSGVRECRPGHDSHISPCGKEYVLFNAAQVLPCFVIHHRERSATEVAQYRKECLQNLLISKEAEGHDRVKRMTAIARKQLPFGFGPAGARFEVLEIAPVDEDDEEYGQYQAALREHDQYGVDEYQAALNEDRALKHVVD